MNERQQSTTLSRLCEVVGNLRVGQARLEAAADESRRWIDAHRQRTTSGEQTNNARFEQITVRVDGLDRRSIDHGHYLKTALDRIGQNREAIAALSERVRVLEVTPRGIRHLEVMAPVALVAAAIIYKLIGGDISSLIQR